MTYKKSTPVLASFFISANIHNVQTLLVERRMPSILLESLSDFVQRNTIVRGECCMRCLKAHLLCKVKEEKSSALVEIIHRAISEEAGHHGYYLDGDELRKV